MMTAPDELIIEPSRWNKCRQAISEEGPTSDDPHIQLSAKVMRIIAHIVQAGGIGAVFGYAASLYNDPDQADNATLTPPFYISIISGGAAVSAITVLKVRRYMQGRDDSKTWITHPSFAAFAAFSVPLVALYLAQKSAQNIYNEILAENAQGRNIEQEQWKAYIKKEDICYQTVYNRRVEFTLPSCSVCLIPSKDYPYQFYQAIYVENIHELICYPKEPYLQQYWGNMGNYSSNTTTDIWPCGGEDFTHTGRQNGFKILMSSLVGIFSPMDVKVEKYSDDCYELWASGTKIRFPASDLCFSPNRFLEKNLSSSICGSPEWSAFATNYSHSFDGYPTRYQDKPYPDRLWEIRNGSDTVWQLSMYSGGLLLVLISFVARICFRCYQRPQRVIPLELENLNSEASENP